ncbi:hypothetical protein [Paenibacillus sp. HGF7]|uniref:hypothetical protein n=1 Tax=Paenibacillus sp. HGF7 TaxID=944559 RepID=UPI00055C270B|nr:hypothetical protein [Paenibacillus sp. HGF7]
MAHKRPADFPVPARIQTGKRNSRFRLGRHGRSGVDYAALLASYGESFFRLVLDKNPEAREMLSRIIFYKGTFALQEALFGVGNGVPEALESGLETLEALE